MPIVNIIHISVELWGIIFFFIAAICVISGKKSEYEKSYILCEIIICHAVFLASDVLAWLFRGNTEQIGYYMVRISNFLYFIAENVLGWFFCDYLKNILEMSGDKMEKWVRYTMKSLVVSSITILIVSQFNHMLYYFDKDNFYHRNALNFLATLPSVIILLLAAYCIFKHRKNLSRIQFLALMSYIVLPIIASVIMIFFYGIAFGNFAVSVSILLVFAVHMVERATKINEQQVKLARQENELIKQNMEIQEARTKLLLGQIKPHFINNCLLLIRNLCRKDSQQAIEAINHFSRYLQRSMAVMDIQQCIPFENEMELVDNYLYMEQLRFVDKIEVKKNIEVRCFSLPPLTVQPIVENAVRHGIRGRQEKGAVIISTKENIKEYIIVVEDNGVGFDVSELNLDGEEHIGLQNVERRLRLVADGMIKIESEPDKGTKVTVFIPKGV